MVSPTFRVVLLLDILCGESAHDLSCRLVKVAPRRHDGGSPATAWTKAGPLARKSVGQCGGDRSGAQPTSTLPGTAARSLARRWSARCWGGGEIAGHAWRRSETAKPRISRIQPPEVCRSGHDHWHSLCSIWAMLRSRNWSRTFQAAIAKNSEGAGGHMLV